MTLAFKGSPRLLAETMTRDSGSDRKLADHRRLKVFSIDPTFGARPGGVVVLEVRYECPEVDRQTGRITGSRFVIDPESPLDLSGGAPSDELVRAGFSLDEPRQLVEHGYRPSLADPRFIAQMVYAVAMSVDDLFRDATGRIPVLGLPSEQRPGTLSAGSTMAAGGYAGSGHRDRLVLKPWKLKDQAQAWFDCESGEIHFGYYHAAKDARGYSPNSRVFTALSHDVIVHELSHAYLDSIHPHLTVPTGDDVLAFHEAFSDLMVIFQRLGYPELVRSQLALARGKTAAFDLLDTLATGFAQTTAGNRTLREIRGEAKLDETGNEPHDRGVVLVQAVYRAFCSVLESRLSRIVSLATNNSGILPDGELASDLLDEFARVAGKTAGMFQSMLIRALDYCTPLGITFFDFLRAVVAADMRLVPSDPEHVREAWMEAFRYHHIFPEDAVHFSEEALADDVLIGGWDPRGGRVTQSVPPPLKILSFSETRFSSEPGQPLSRYAALLQVNALAGELANCSKWQDWLISRYFLGDIAANPVKVISLRSFARPGPRRMTEFGTVVKLLQPMPDSDDHTGFLRAGAVTLLFDSEGKLIAAAGKKAGHHIGDSERRFVESKVGRRNWIRDRDGTRTLARNYFLKVCAR